MFKKFESLFDSGKMFELLKDRLFLILVDTIDFDNSWKLKRDIKRLRDGINCYLDNFDKNKILNNPVKFEYKFRPNEIFYSYSDCIFIAK